MPPQDRALQGVLPGGRARLPGGGAGRHRHQADPLAAGRVLGPPAAQGLCQEEDAAGADDGRAAQLQEVPHAPALALVHAHPEDEAAHRHGQH